MLAEQVLHGVDGGADALDQGIAVPGVADRRREHVAERQRAVVAQEQHVGVEGAWHAGGEKAGAGYEIEAERAEMLDGRASRRAPLAADDLGPAPLCRVDHDRNVAAGPVEVRLHHLQREGRRDPGVEGVAAALEHAHPDGRRDPMRAGHDPEGPLDLGAGREAVRVDVLRHASRLPGQRARNLTRSGPDAKHWT
jgi:hypothetical protein